MTNAGAIKKFYVNGNKSASFKFKKRITSVTAAGGTKMLK